MNGICKTCGDIFNDGAFYDECQECAEEWPIITAEEEFRQGVLKEQDE